MSSPLRRKEALRVYNPLEFRLTAAAGNVDKRVGLQTRYQLGAFHIFTDSRYSELYKSTFSGSVGLRLGRFMLRTYAQYRLGEWTPNFSASLTSGRLHWTAYYKPYSDQGNMSLRFDIGRRGYLGLRSSYIENELQAEVELSLPFKLNLYRRKKLKRIDREAVRMTPVKIK